MMEKKHEQILGLIKELGKSERDGVSFFFFLNQAKKKLPELKISELRDGVRTLFDRGHLIWKREGYLAVVGDAVK